MSMTYAPRQTMMHMVRRAVFWGVFIILLLIEIVHNTSGLLSASGFMGLTLTFVFASVFITFYTPSNLLLAVFGIMADLYFGAPIIVSATLYIILKYFAFSQRIALTQQGFGVIWAIFSFLIGAALVLYWVMNGIILGFSSPEGHFMNDYLIILVTFPIFYYLLTLGHRAFPVAL